MLRARTFVLLALLATTFGAAKDKDKDKNKLDEWLPVTPQDLAVKEVPNDPGLTPFSCTCVITKMTMPTLSRLTIA
jgi:hypothetical protein